MESGIDVSQAREFEFVVVFPSKIAAEAFALNLRNLGFVVSIESGTAAKLPWETTVRNTMLPIHANVVQFEGTLAELAEPLGERNDGWGTLVPSSHKPTGHNSR
jgi:hypothetical protein